MKSFQSLIQEAILNEKTYSLDRDINYLFKISKFDRLLEIINSQDWDEYIEFLARYTDKTKDGHLLLQTDTSKLTNRVAKTAHKVNPCKIRIGIFSGGNYYKPQSNLIQLTLNTSALDLLMYKNTFDRTEQELGTQFKRFKNEFQPHNVKGSFYHELTHWIDDSLTNVDLKGKINRKNLKGKHNNVNHTEFEINAQIHKVKELKKSLTKKEFDNIGWKELFQYLPSLTNNFKNFRSDDEMQEMVKKFVKRLHREKLLPKKIKNINTREINNILRIV